MVFYIDLLENHWFLNNISRLWSTFVATSYDFKNRLIQLCNQLTIFNQASAVHGALHAKDAIKTSVKVRILL